MKSFRFFFSESKKQEDIKDFISFASDYLQLKNSPKVTFVKERDGNISTANFNMATLEIKVYVKDRAKCDICRSIAHELVHQKQLEETGGPLDGTTGSKHEDEANALAGRVIREYGKKYPNFYN